MRKFIAIFFLFLFSISATEAGQLVKLPRLIAHYSEFKKQSSGSFFDFIAEHYLISHPNDGDEREDAQLPFKMINADCFSCIYVAANFVEISGQFSNSFVSHQLFQSPYIDNKGQLGIFRPPRHC